MATNRFSNIFPASANPVVEEWTDFTPVWTNDDGLSFGSDYARYRRNGDGIDLQVGATVTADGTNGGTLSFSLPNGLTYSSNQSIGVVTLFDDQTTNQLVTGQVRVTGNTELYFQANQPNGLAPTSLNGNSFGVSTGNYTQFAVYAHVPIDSWAGTGTSTGVNKVEYAYTTDTFDSDASTTGYGQSGQQMTALTTARTKDISFQEAIQAGDEIKIQFSEDQVGWADASVAQINGTSVIQQIASDASLANSSGVSWKKTGDNAIQVKFHRYQAIQNDDGVQANWGTSGYWRVVKHSAGIPVGFGQATADSAGLVSRQARGSGTTFPSEVWGGTDPTTLVERFYEWERVGNMVVINWRVEYSVAGTNVTYLNIELPSDAPLPRDPNGVGINTWWYAGSGFLANSRGGSPAQESRTALYRGSGSYNLYIYCDDAGKSAKYAQGTLTYFTDA